MKSTSIFLILLLLGVCFLSGRLQAQDQKPADTFIDTYKWDVSLDMYRLLRSGDASILLRYAPNHKGAYRLALEGGVTNRKFEILNDTIHDNIYIEKSGNIGVAGGYEWHQSIGRHQVYYGTDLYFSYRANRSYYVNPIALSFAPSRSYTWRVSPFIGIKYRLLSRLSISAEATLALSQTILHNLELDRKEVVNRNTTTSLGLIPLRFINISYHF